MLTGEELERAKAQMFLDRGYTSHEHFWEVEIIHMNGRLYDPILRRFLNTDENIQAPHNTQNYNKYDYMFNNPLMYNDPSGEFIWWLPAAIAVFSHAIQSYYMNQPMSFEGLMEAMAVSYISAGMSYGIGEVFKAGGEVAKALGEYAVLVKRLVHGISGGIQSVVQGGSFGSGAISAILGDIGGEASLKYLGENLGASMLTGFVMGGIGSELAGGNFWVGAVTGTGVSIFNHYAHKQQIKDVIREAFDDPDGVPEANMDSVNEAKMKVKKLFNKEMLKYQEGNITEKIDLVSDTNMAAEIKNNVTIYGEGKSMYAKYGQNATIIYFKGAFSSWYFLGATILHEYYHLADYRSGIGNRIATENYKKFGNTMIAARKIRIQLEKRAFNYIKNLGAIWSDYSNFKHLYENN